MDISINILYPEPIQLKNSTLSSRDPEGKWDLHDFFKQTHPDARQKGHISLNSYVTHGYLS